MLLRLVAIGKSTFHCDHGSTPTQFHHFQNNLILLRAQIRLGPSAAWPGLCYFGLKGWASLKCFEIKSPARTVIGLENFRPARPF